MVDFDSQLIPPDPSECEHPICEFCDECHAEGCFLFQPLCDSAREEQEKHKRHIEKNVYWGGCDLCKREQEAKEEELVTRKITHLSFFYMDGTGYVRGLVEGAQTQEDLVWAARISFLKVNDPSDKLEVARQTVAINPLAKDAIWTDEDAFQALVDTLPPARQPQSYVDFGDPSEDQGR
jgi:hypothetical protein